MLTPNEVTDDKPSDPSSWPKDDGAVLTWVLDKQKKAEQRLGEWYEAARKDFGFYENKQWTEEDVAKLESERRVAVTFNRIASTVNSIAGQEVANRQEVKFLPRRVGAISGSDPMNDAVKWFRENCNAEDEDSDAFKDMVICGMGWTCSRMDYEVNQEGEPVVERRDPILMRWDPAARRKNLADMKWVQSDYWMTKEAIEERWPDADLAGLVNLRAPAQNSDPHDSTENWKYKNDASGYEHFQDQWRVVHHVERFTQKAYRVLDPATQQIQSYGESDYKLLAKRAKVIGLKLQAVPARKRVYWESWTVGKTVLASGIAKIQKDFQYQCMTCVRERETGFWFGIVRLMIDPQRYANRMASLMMSILATGAKGGLLYETGAFVNPKKAKQDWARWDSAIELNEGALAAGKIQAKPPVAIPPGASELLQFAITSIRDVTGVNIEMLGMRQENQPGIVEDMRTKAGLVILACVFDAKRLYVKRQAIILAEFVSKFLSDGRLIRIWGAEGQQFIPLVRSDAVEYDLIVDESPASRDVKERTWLVLKELVPGLMQMGIQLPPEIMDYAPVPESLAMTLKKAIAQKAQQPPQPPPEVMKAQAQAQAQQQIATVKAQATQASEQARVQADVQIEHDKAQVNLQLQAMKAQMDQHFQQQQAVLQHNTAILTAIINQMGKVAAAEVTASKDTDEEARAFTQAGAYPQQ